MASPSDTAELAPPVPIDGSDDVAFAVFLPLLDRLPIAAAIVTPVDDTVRIVAANARFSAILRARRENPPLTVPDTTPIVDLIRALLGDRGTPSSVGADWREGDAAAGRHFRVHLSRLEMPDEAPPACLVTLLDRTVEIESARSLRAELLQDSLTGLPNRIAFAEAVDELVATQGGGCHAVLLVDLARFSRVNESLGAMAGDEVILTVARRLISTLRAGDLLARVGGDEFGVLLRAEGGMDEVIAAAKRIQAVLANPFRLAQFEIGLECAIGCALDGSDHAGGEELVRNAQLALKRAKDTGRIEWHSSGEVAFARAKLDIETELRRAIDKDALTLAFQPIVDLASDRLVGFEALSRWHHPVRGAIPPTEFIPIAEEAGLIVPLGRWAIDCALATLAAWDAATGAPLPLTVSVNVSAIQLARDDVPEMIAAALATHGISGDRLIVELTESAIVHDPDRATRALKALKALNVRVAMDDFGTGYSSLSYLRHLPIDILKIDRSFVSGMLADRDKIAIVRAVLSLADALGKQTTAEGVETGALSQTLAALGCTHGQGYHYAKPLAADDALAYWRARNA